MAAGKIDQALVYIDDAFIYREESGTHFWRSELHRLKGECLLLRDGVTSEGLTEVEQCLTTARSVAQEQGARSLEL